MKALIFAAGLGERMRPLTDTTPKPLLPVGGKPLIEWHIEKLAAMGVQDIVINTSWLAGQFPLALGDGARWGVRLHFLYEGHTPLETGGGMRNALSVLGDEPFVAINGDIWCDVDLTRFAREPAGVAHLLLVDNPAHNPQGDFTLLGDGSVISQGEQRLTFAGVGVYRPTVLENWRTVIGDAPGSDDTPPRFKLAPLLRVAMAQRRVTGQHHYGAWTDVGTPQRLAELEADLAASQAMHWMRDH